uniref:ATP synthase subunit a, chloroplastic n=1 Tax=Nitzschia sp. IriIs04 TaxID=1444690 RepID=A0A0S3QPK1_9STRA|nr:ATP synthase CF0 A chain subunit IV [Nitzschia sp. IriIs04]BAT70270.1 ATP synthase CF0 A chain subunit IV [Nitzschia sp. IriIs04]
MILQNIEIGKHLYWKIFDFYLHGQVILMCLFVCIIITIIAFLGFIKINIIPNNFQNFNEIIVLFLIDLTENQLGKKHYKEWLPFIGTLFLFILISNCIGEILPLKLITLPESELNSPTNDLNTTIALAFLTSISYFYAGISEKGLYYFKKYLHPSFVFLPLNILEDFTKPLSLSFRLFGNVLADELIIVVLTSLVPIFIPLPFIMLSFFSGSIQALIFSILSTNYIAESLE